MSQIIYLTFVKYLNFFGGFEEIVVTQEGSITGKEDWGLRDLSYKINSFKKAFYLFFQINDI